MEEPYRRYFLVEIPFENWNTTPVRGVYEANLVWPKDRSWFLSTDIDATSSYVGGTADAIAEIIDSPDLESARANLKDRVSLA